MEQSIFRQELFGWMIALVVGLPTVLVVLGELIERFQERGNPLAQGLRQVRHVVVPLLALLIVLRQVLGVAGAERWSQVITTLFWVSVIYTGLMLVQNLVRLGESTPSAWVNKIPVLFFTIARAIIVLLVGAHVLSGIWGFEFGQVTKIVGIGSMALALALQDTLSNLVSGFLLLADRPFKVDDWCRINGQWMQVKQIGWRTTRFESSPLGTVIIPNGSLGKEEIINHGQEGSLYKWYLKVGFSYDDPPSLVKSVLYDVLNGIDEIRHDRVKKVYVTGYDDYIITYQVFFLIDFWDYGVARDKFFAQLYYAARRHGLTIPYPIRTVHQHVLEPSQAPVDVPLETIGTTLQAIPLFQALPPAALQEMGTNAAMHRYGVSERIVRQGEPDAGLYIVQSGTVTLSARNREAQEQEILHLTAGDVFGEMALLGNEHSLVSVTVTADAQILIIDHALINQLVSEHPPFATALNVFIEERKRTMRAVIGHEEVASQQTARHELLTLLVADGEASRNGK